MYTKKNRSAQLTENFCTPCTSVLRGGRNPPKNTCYLNPNLSFP